MVDLKMQAMKGLLLVLFCIHVRGIQVYEHIESDTTSEAPTLLPTRLPDTQLDTNSSMDSSTSASTTTETLPIETLPTLPTSTRPPTNSTKQPRIQTSMKTLIDSSRIDQQPRSTTNIDNKNFVPSPQISVHGTPISSSDYSRENVLPLPLNTNTKPSYDPNPFQPYMQYQTQQPIMPSAAKTALDTHSPYFYNPPPTIADNIVINDPWKVAPTSGDTGKWYWMPNTPQPVDIVPTTRIPPTPTHVPPHWKWSFENKLNEIPLNGGGDCCANGGDIYLRPSPSPEVHHSEHPYSFDPVVHGHRHGSIPKPFNTQHHNQNHHHHYSVFSSNGGGGSGGGGSGGGHGGGSAGVGEGVFATQITETEYDHVIKGGGYDGHSFGTSGEGGTGITGELLNGLKKPKSKGTSPWKKILHVLTAAIPIGLLISAFTPQYVYVDPNSTASQPPFGKYENRYNRHNPIHRALEGETNAGAGAAAAGRWFVPSNESLANLFVEVNALFADEDSQRSTSTGAPNDHESDDDDGGDYGGGHGSSGGNHDDNQPHKYPNNNNNNDNSHNGDAAQQAADHSEAKCQFRDLCEISLLGAAPNSHVVHRMLWTLANENVERPGLNDGVRKLFRGVREHDCSGFECVDELRQPQQQDR